ncbi:MAG: sodium:proton antiporter [Candidatus Melainabacteria bacterium]|nr:MAG: sodium:proton antiporter [Candidatus Melainabacteria bacterium]RAI13719.1 MAG: sodium:proton antiporter [Candidatus Melainabacteria bacterium]
MDSTIFLNPVLISIILLCVLCLCKINVLLSIMISAIVAGLIAHMGITDIMNTFISGMGTNAETALSYILLGAFAAAMTHTGLATVLAKKITQLIKNNAFILYLILTVIAILSQNLIPVHIAFIPILIPPLLHVMNVLKIDRRAIACCLAFGLKAPYIVIPAGFGLIFQGLLADNMVQNGMNVSINEIWKSTWILGLGMFVGLLVAIFISYRKPREYKDVTVKDIDNTDTKLTKEHYITLLAAIATLGVQLWTKSLPLGALVGLGIIFGTGTIKHKKMDNLVDEGIGLMGYIAFVMLVAAGFALVLKQTGGIESLVNSTMAIMPSNKIAAALLMLITGLFITIGIGTSFGTIPILAVIFVPICAQLGFNLQETIVVFAAAAALGDAGSPASDTTLGPTAGLNADGQHNHIWDTCIPTFLHYNTAIIIFALIGVIIF